MATVELDVEKWAQQNFGDCQLGDARRNKRAVKLAAQMAAHPDGSTPTQTESWADCKAAYRLMSEENVSFEALCEPHWQQTRAQSTQSSGTFLLIGDTTEFDFGSHRDVQGLAPNGNGGGLGFLLHSSLMVGAQTDEVVGLAAAEIFHRRPAPQSETLMQKRQRPRESEIWGRVVDRVGKPPAGVKFLHVFDAGADNFEVFCHLKMQETGWVVRAAQKRRVVLDEDRTRRGLLELVGEQPLAGTYELSLRASKQQAARTASVEVRFAPLRMPPPVQKTPFMKDCGIEEIPMWVVEVREVDAPPSVEEPLHWVLLTSEPVESFEDAWLVVGYYEKRPIIEDYHKCAKTGCRVEARQYRTSDRLERVTGMQCILAVRLLQLKFIARADPGRPAKGIVPNAWLNMLQAVRKGTHQIKTVRDFFRSLAKLGGFLGRKRDGEPGWITIWRGLDKLLVCLRGAEAMYQKCG